MSVGRDAMVVPTRRRRAGGRAITTALDRVALALYAASRWGGPELAGRAGVARRAIGECRDPGAFIAAIAGDARPAHYAALAALGFFDDAGSRAAVVAYVQRMLDARADAVPVAALEQAAYALAPLAVAGHATVLSGRERTCLVALAVDERADVRLRASARRVPRAWDERWGRDRLLYL